MHDNIAIKVDSVSKNFRLPHEGAGTLKGLFVNPFSAKPKGGSEVQHALKNVSFDVKEGEFFGIVGRNGSGKSTLLKMMAGIYQPTKGSITVEGRLVPFIELGVGFSPELTGRENVYLNGAMLGFSKKYIDKKYKDIVDFAEIERFMDQKLKNYSSGMQVRLAFSVATVLAQSDVLLIDEVLAVGDADFQRKCFEYFKDLKKRKKTVVFVTHDMNAVREFCDRAVLIDKSEVIFMGRPSDVATRYSRLFMQNNKISGSSNSKEAKRWGSGGVKFTDVQAVVRGDNLEVNARANVSVSVDKLLYGIHVFSQDGKEITATNNRMIQSEDAVNLKPGSKIDFHWNMLNIFNDGKYYISLSLVSDTSEILDWYTEAAWFSVKREARSTTSVIPPITVRLTTKLGAKKKGRDD